MTAPHEIQPPADGSSCGRIDPHALPESHVLRPLEVRMLEMCDDMHPAMRVLGGNFVAALRVFAAKHPTLREDDGQ